MWELCAARKAGSDISARQDVHTHRHGLRNLAGSHERISRTTSAGGGKGVLAPAAERRSNRPRFDAMAAPPQGRETFSICLIWQW
jgi:hypothetical protein